jgi:hypothetical protein
MPTLSFTTAYTVPGSPQNFTLDPSQYDAQGYVRLTWTNGSQDPAWYAWRLYRRVQGSGNIGWALVYEVRTSATTYAFNDYTAPSNITSEYALVQVVNSNGTRVEGARTAQPISAISTYYWLMTPELPARSVRLGSVRGHSFGGETEQAEINIIGRGRHVETGTEWGERGTLDIQVFDTAFKTARQARLDLEYIKASGLAIFLRDPYSKVIQVSIGNFQIARVAGIGPSHEAFTTSLPYSQVS